MTRCYSRRGCVRWKKGASIPRRTLRKALSAWGAKQECGGAWGHPSRIRKTSSLEQVKTTLTACSCPVMVSCKSIVIQVPTGQYFEVMAEHSEFILKINVAPDARKLNSPAEWQDGLEMVARHARRRRDQLLLTPPA